MERLPKNKRPACLYVATLQSVPITAMIPKSLGYKYIDPPFQSDLVPVLGGSTVRVFLTLEDHLKG